MRRSGLTHLEQADLGDQAERTSEIGREDERLWPHDSVEARLEGCRPEEAEQLDVEPWRRRGWPGLHGVDVRVAPAEQ